MRKLILASVILCASLAALAQSKDFVISTSVDSCISNGVDVKVSYAFPDDDPFIIAAKMNPALAPATIIWFWGDEEMGAKTKNFTQVPWVKGQVLSHIFKKTGKYSITVIINDSKNRNIKQATVKITIGSPVIVEKN